MKYTTVEVSGVIISIAKTTDIPCYTETILEPMLPTDEELDKMSDNQQYKWTAENNKRMRAICDFLNKSNL